MRVRNRQVSPSMFSLVLIFLCVLSPGARNCIAADFLDEKVGLVEILVSDTYGKAIKKYSLEVLSEEKDQLRYNLTPDNSRLKLPYGRYVLRGKAPLYNWVEQTFEVKQQERFVSVAFPPRLHGESGDINSRLYGRIKGIHKSAGRYWVRVMPLYGQHMRESAVDQSGVFVVEDVPLGEYIVVLFSNLSVVNVSRFEHKVKRDEILISLE